MSIADNFTKWFMIFDIMKYQLHYPISSHENMLKSPPAVGDFSRRCSVQLQQLLLWPGHSHSSNALNTRLCWAECMRNWIFFQSAFWSPFKTMSEDWQIGPLTAIPTCKSTITITSFSENITMYLQFLYSISNQHWYSTVSCHPSLLKIIA